MDADPHMATGATEFESRRRVFHSRLGIDQRPSTPHEQSINSPATQVGRFAFATDGRGKPLISTDEI